MMLVARKGSGQTSVKSTYFLQWHMSYKLSSLLLPETFEKIPSSCCSFEELPGGLAGKEFAHVCRRPSFSPCWEDPEKE